MPPIVRTISRCFACGLISMLLFSLNPSQASAQSRLSDKDVEKLMDNLKEDTKKFRSSFNSAVEKSTIRNTDQEKQSKSLVERFQKQTEDMLHDFKDKKNADTQLKAVRDSASEIDKVLASTTMGGDVGPKWMTVRTELTTISKAFGIDTPALDAASAK